MDKKHVAELLRRMFRHWYCIDKTEAEVGADNLPPELPVATEVSECTSTGGERALFEVTFPGPEGQSFQILVRGPVAL